MAGAVSLQGGESLDASFSSPLLFESDVRPILKAACFHCHGEAGEKKGKLDARLVRLLVEGGKSGPAIVPGAAEKSRLWERIASDEMPEGEKKLTAEQKAVIRAWIDQGAKTARPEPDDPEEARFTEEELSHWAFQPVGNPSPPGVEAHPVDAFITKRLRREGLGPSGEAERHTLIRRASFDITGLPPEPGEVDAFLADRRPDAYERLVDRLLASPQFGVRWARHWLDAAGYAESDGGPSSDTKRPHAWRYRDYVIDSFNRNKPIDSFLKEQLAGDEMIAGEPEVGNARHLELLTATGYLRMAPDPTQAANGIAERNMAVADAMQVVGTSLLGLTVGCAQCHDHKYDPIGTDDYYGFRAIFDPAFSLKNWQQPGNRLVDMTTDAVRRERERIEAVAKKQQDELQARRMAHCAEIQEKKLADVPDADREATRDAVLTESAERSARQRGLLDLYPMVKPVNFISGLLVEYDNAAYRKFQDEQKKVDAIRATKPPQRMIRITTEPLGPPPPSHVFFRGDPESPRQAVTPGEIGVLRRHRELGEIPRNDRKRRTTGRRLAYAEQLTDGTHPLTARVFVNRVWKHYMGRGLVATPGDFGVLGEPPSHPELLDWLARDFVENGWDHKRLHRLILLSKTYRQRSQRRSELEKVDPENRLYGRANLKRLEAEVIRDALLAVTGQLVSKVSGPSTRVSLDREGKAVLGGDGAAKACRSVFVEVQRSVPLDMLATFDQPAMTPNCNARRHTTVATQALWFLNDNELIGHTRRLAESFGDADRRQKLSELYQRLFAIAPSSRELEICDTFLTEQEKHFQKSPEIQALASLCQVLLASNRFLYVD